MMQPCSMSEEEVDSECNTVYLLRHAQSTYNASHGKINQVDADLSQAGQLQARGIVGKFDLVLCSPLRRARKTLELSQIEYGEIEILEDARELKSIKSDFLEGEIMVRETHEDMQERVKRLKLRLFEELSNGKRVLVVTHSVVIRTLTSPIMESWNGVKVKNGNIFNYHLKL